MAEEFTGPVHILDSASGERTVWLDGDHGTLGAGGHGQDGDLSLSDSAGNQTVWIDGQTGNILVKNAAGDFRFRVVGSEGDIQVYRRLDGVQRPVLAFDASSAILYIGCEGNEGDIYVRNNAGDTTFQVDGNSGDIYVRRRIDGSLRQVMRFSATAAAFYVGCEGNEGDIFIRNNDGDNTIHLDGQSGDIRLMGADCAEQFDVVESKEIDPGTVLVIDGESKLQPCAQPYDRKVAGVVSGGNGSNPGIILDKNPTQSARLPIALNGKVYCKVDAQYASIEVGDLLTTSPTPGHAMKADDPMKAFGAVIGKALRPVREGADLIPILVALQ